MPCSGLKHSFNAYKGLVPISPNTTPIAASIKVKDAPFRWPGSCREISTGLSSEESENSGLLTDINKPCIHVAWQYVTPYAGCLKPLIIGKKRSIYAPIEGKPRQRGPKNGRISASDAGWSSLAARRAHNPKVVGSNPAPATSITALSPYLIRAFCLLGASF